MAHRGPAEPGCPRGERDRELAVLRGLSVISVVWALASPLALPASLPLFPIPSEVWTPLARGLPFEEPGTQPELCLSSPRFLPEGGMPGLYNIRIPEGTGAPCSCIVSFTEVVSPELSHPPGGLCLLTLFTEGAQLASLPGQLVWWPQWGSEV